MTRDEIMAMEPGRELDTAVAVAKGWRRSEHGGVGLIPPEASTMSDIARTMGVYPYWSTDICAAWGLVEECPMTLLPVLVGERSAEVWWAVINYTIETDSGFPFLIIDEHVEEGMLFRTAPEAICKAYLLWKGEGDDAQDRG